MIYEQNANNQIEDLKENITNDIREVELQLYQNIMENIGREMEACRLAAIGQLQNIIFIIESILGEVGICSNLGYVRALLGKFRVGINTLSQGPPSPVVRAGLGYGLV
ncbi:hypothetical protein Trydic_g11519 [Trypoxylus dichotomus]